MANDVRFRRPNVIIRQGTLLYTFLEFYLLQTTCLTEIQAYNAAGQSLGYCFTDGDNFMMATSSATYTAYGIVPRTIGLIWVFDNPTVAAQAVSFHLWLYSTSGLQLDAY